MNERIFSVPAEDVSRVSEHIECVNCGATFPTRDLQNGKLSSDECPTCRMKAKDFFWE